MRIFVIFNAADLTQMGADLRGMLGLGGLPFITTETLYYLRSYGLVLLVSILGATPLPKKAAEKLEHTPVFALVEPVVLCALLLAVTAFLVDGSFNPFLYFRF